MLTLICGRSRAGKTTYSERYDGVLHCDSVRAKCGEKYPKIYELVSQRDDIVLDGLFETAEKRIGLLQAYKGDHPKQCIWLDTDIGTIALRTTSGRSGNPKYVRPHTFEPPTLSEGWDEIIIIRGENVERINRETHH